MPSEYAILERANETGYLPRPQPQRAFTDDYRKPVEGVVGSRLGVDIDGRPIADSAIVAGRRRVQGDDVALARDELERAIGGITGGASYVPRRDLPKGAIGTYNVAHMRGMRRVSKMRRLLSTNLQRSPHARDETAPPPRAAKRLGLSALLGHR